MRSILIAEDDTLVRNNLAEILSVNNFNVYTAENGYECFIKAKEVYPDLIISDIMMPEMDGEELLTALRNDNTLSFVPFIFLTAKSTYEDLRAGMIMGADDYLFKPVSIADLLNSINTVLAKYEKHEKRMNELRDRIALTVPHEFRTPLTAILGYSEMLKNDIQYIIENDEIHFVIDNLSFAAKRFNNLVQKFTNYANATIMLNSPKEIRNISKKNVSSVKMVLQMIAFKIADKYKRLQDLELELLDVDLNYDEFYLSYMIEELLDNAMKYSQAGSKICLRTFVRESKLLISILDFGIGMTAEQIRSVAAFNQFVDPLIGRTGNGIGLITVQRISEVTSIGFNIESKPGNYTEVSLSFDLDNLN